MSINDDIFLDNLLIKIDVDIPIGMMRVGNQEDREHKFHAAWQNMKDRKEGIFGGINGLISENPKFNLERNIGCAAIMVTEMGRLHHETKKSSGYDYHIEMGIKLLNNDQGKILHESANNKKIDYFLRGSIDISEYGDIGNVEFTEITAMIPTLSNYEESMNKIFNKNLLDYCSYDIREKFERKKYPFNNHTSDEKIEFVGNLLDHI